MLISMDLERRPAVQILKMWVLRRQLVSCDFLIRCFALPEVVGEGLKSSIPNLFPREPSYRISHPPARVNEKPFPCPWLCLPPFLYACFPCRIHLQMISLVCILSLAACPPIYQVSAARRRLALSSLLHCSSWPRGRCVCVWGGEGRWVSPTAPGARARAAAGRQCSWEDTITRGDWQLPLPVWHWQMTLQGQQPWASPQTLADIMG